MHYKPYSQRFPKGIGRMVANALFYHVKHIVLLFACCFTCCFTHAQESQPRAEVWDWDTYMAMYENKPASILVDMSLIDRSPDKKYPNLVVTGPQAKSCNNLGIPDTTEITVLEDILTATGNFLAGVTPKILAGTFTFNCQRLNYYYVKDTTGIRNALARMYARSYPDYRYSVNIKNDPYWKTYRTFLYPDEATENWMENNRVISGMIRSGDSLKTPRDIYFDFYFTSDTARQAFETAAVAKGYNTSRKTQSSKKPELYAIVLAKNSPALLNEVNKMTTELKQIAKDHNGHYTGLDATVKPNSTK